MAKRTEFTDEQIAAINAKGDTIVSASAGSGKTSVMIERMVKKLVDENVSLENVLAVTFTKKAAANMKDRLRTRIGEEISDIANGEGKYAERSKEDRDALKDRLEAQYDLIPTADISTIDSFCLKLIKTYFYVLGRDANAEIITADDSEAAELCEKALDNLFNGADGKGGYYGSQDGKPGDEAFKVLLKYLRSGRRDDEIKETLLSAYNTVRTIDDYRGMLDRIGESYTEDNFEKLCESIKESDDDVFRGCLKKIREFRDATDFGQADEAYYNRVYDDLTEFFEARIEDGLCDYPEDLKIPSKASIKELESAKGKNWVTKDTKEKMNLNGPGYTNFRNDLVKAYKTVQGRRSYEEEKAAYFRAGDVAKAFITCLLEFDKEYAGVKKEENKVDYSDLEHFAVDLLAHKDVKEEVNEKYVYVFVDEFQDINSVQDMILNAFDNKDGERFYVGDEKQAIYGFRGSESKYFSEMFEKFEKEGKNAIRLTKNFRSDDVVIEKANEVFLTSMTKEVCDIEYGEGHAMTGRGTNGSGSAIVHKFSTDKKGEAERDEIYSVRYGTKKGAKHAEADKVLEIVDGYLDPERGGTYRPSDICILSYKEKGARGIAKELGKKYAVAGSGSGNILDDAEIRQVLDILSYIDNGEQDVPMISTMLSPVGAFTEEELAELKAYDKNAAPSSSKERGKKPFRECVREYRDAKGGELACKIAAFDDNVADLRQASQILSAGALIDKILADTGLELKFSRDAEKLRTLSLLAAEGEDMTLSAFLKAVNGNDVKINMPACAASDGINVMTMHGSKGLEFPVVIICDAAASFKGKNEYICLFDKELGFAFNSYEDDTMTRNKTFLWKAVDAKHRSDDIKEKLNLFYVACTRAEHHLDIMSSKIVDYDASKVRDGGSFADIADLHGFEVKDEDVAEDKSEEKPAEPAAEPVEEPAKESAKESVEDFGGLQMEDTVAHEEIEGEGEKAEADDFIEKFGDVFEKKYRHTYSDYPAKTTVSAAVREDEAIARRMYDESAEYEKGEKRADGAEASDVGTAYHKFLELCDFAIRDAAGIESEIERLFAAGKMTKSQKDILLNDLRDGDDVGPVEALRRVCDELYSKGTPKDMRRERRFLCNLPAMKVYGEERENADANAEREDSRDEVLVQGIMDLLVQYEDGSWRIIDYKHSTKGMGALWETYGKQLELYRAAAAKILDVEEGDIGTTLVNINSRMSV